jgi:hypothetical protein
MVFGTGVRRFLCWSVGMWRTSNTATSYIDRLNHGLYNLRIVYAIEKENGRLKKLGLSGFAADRTFSVSAVPQRGSAKTPQPEQYRTDNMKSSPITSGT